MTTMARGIHSDAASGESPDAHQRAGWRTLLRAWYRLTTPRVIGPSINGRERVRRVRLSSLLLLVVTSIWLMSGFVVVINFSLPNILTFIAGVLICVLLMVFNRAGKVELVAMTLCTAINGGALLIIYVSPASRVDLSSVFTMLLYTECIAASLLATWTVFVAAVLN